MYRAFSLLIFLLIASMAFGQKKRSSASRVFIATKAQEILIEKYEQCTNSHRYTAGQRRAFFPFGSANSIRLISYESDAPNSPITLEGEEYIPIPPEDTVMENFFPMAVNNFKVNYCRVKEIKDLSVAGIDSLTDILYNVGFTPVKNLPDYPVPGHNCYSPSNAILFLDAEGNVTQYIEFCFGCERYFYSSSKTTSVSYCRQKYDMLRAFFLGQKIKYGAERYEEN